ncbi:hypothetical protein [Sorangium sp. So ce124]|uniref:hypothetical protein n=1 Tax=Sorangium sp. So ce124 TaxID=3133280 RepID=UPI003F5D7843
MTRKEAVAEHRRTSRRVEMGAPPAVHVPFEVIMRHSRMIHAVLRQFGVPAENRTDVFIPGAWLGSPVVTATDHQPA